MLVLYALPKIAFVNLNLKSCFEKRKLRVCTKAVGTFSAVEYLSPLHLAPVLWWYTQKLRTLLLK